MIGVLLGAGIPVAYLIIGLFLGRAVFLSMAPTKEERERLYATEDFTNAAFAAGATILGWPLVGAFILIRHWIMKPVNDWDEKAAKRKETIGFWFDRSRDSSVSKEDRATAQLVYDTLVGDEW